MLCATYLTSSDAQLIALTREKRRSRISDRVKPRTRYYSDDVPLPFRPLRSTCRQRAHRPEDRLHRMLDDLTFQAFWALQHGKCYLCGKGFVEEDWATVDHVFPRSLGGADEENRLLACMSCNQGKADTLPTPCEVLFCEGVYLWFEQAMAGLRDEAVA